MSDVTKLLFLADDVHDDPRFAVGIVRGNEPSITIRVSPRWRNHMVTKLCETIREMCCQDRNIEHHCVTTWTMLYPWSSQILIVYGRRCLKSTEEVEAFLHVATGLAHQARIATIRDATHC